MRKLVSLVFVVLSLAALIVLGRAYAEEMFVCLAPVFDASVLVGR